MSSAWHLKGGQHIISLPQAVHIDYLILFFIKAFTIHGGANSAQPHIAGKLRQHQQLAAPPLIRHLFVHIPNGKIYMLMQSISKLFLILYFTLITEVIPIGL